MEFKYRCRCGGEILVVTKRDAVPAEYTFSCSQCGLGESGVVQGHWFPSKRGYWGQDEFNLASWRVAVALSGVEPLYFGHYGSEDSRDIDLLLVFPDKIPEAIKDEQFWQPHGWARGRVDPTVVAIQDRRVVQVLRDETEFSIPIEDIQNCIYRTVDADLVDYIPPAARDVEGKRRQAVAYAELSPEGLSHFQRDRHNKRTAFVGIQYLALLKGKDAGYTKASVMEWAKAHRFSLRSIIYPPESGWGERGPFWMDAVALATLQRIVLAGEFPRRGKTVEESWRAPWVYDVAPAKYGPVEHDPSLDMGCLICGALIHEDPYPLSHHDVWTETDILCEKHAAIVEDNEEFQAALQQAKEASRWDRELSVSLHREGEVILVEIDWGFTESGSPGYGESAVVKIPIRGKEG